MKCFKTPDLDLPTPESETMNYANQIAEKQACYGTLGRGLADCVDQNPTVGENIDKRIASMKAEIERLEESKKTLGPLLPMRISDIRNAMNY